MTLTERVRILWVAGMKAEDIGRIVGKSSSYVRSIAWRAGLERRQGRYGDKNDAEIRKLWRKGMVAEKIAPLVGVSSRTVYNRLRAMGLERRTYERECGKNG